MTAITLGTGQTVGNSHITLVMTLEFQKMHGLGNDFVVIDARNTRDTNRAGLTPALIRRLADRRRGIGCDQVIVIEDGKDTAAARLKFFNADGSPSGACGNGTRCAADLLSKDLGRTEFSVLVGDAALRCTVEGPLITVDMGRPRLDWQGIPLSGAQDTARLDLSADGFENPSAVGMGNPHCVFFTDDAEAVPLERVGPMVETHALFPERTNVEFAQILDRQTIRLRVWERGAGITQACGSGACATLVAAARRGLTDRSASIHLDGGTLIIEWSADDSVLMRGPASWSFRGILDDAWLADGEGA